MGKFPALFELLGNEHIISESELMTPVEASLEDLERVHTPEYLRALELCTLDAAAERRLGLPWTPALWRRSRLAVQGTILAAEAALDEGLAANLAGGTHHAFSGHGEGYCVLNDVAVAVRFLRASHPGVRFLVVDLDVHQGNGTATILREDPGAHTFSIHATHNYPLRKVESTCDVSLPDGTGDTAYLDALQAHLEPVICRSRPDLVFYLAGVDVAKGDRFGRFELTRDGLRERERLVFESLKAHGIPVVLLLAGGYAATAEVTADLHAITHRVAREVFR